MQESAGAPPLLVFPQGNLTASNEIRKGGFLFFVPIAERQTGRHPVFVAKQREGTKMKRDRFCVNGRMHYAACALMILSGSYSNGF